MNPARFRSDVAKCCHMQGFHHKYGEVFSDVLWWSEICNYKNGAHPRLTWLTSNLLYSSITVASCAVSESLWTLFNLHCILCIVDHWFLLPLWPYLLLITHRWISSFWRHSKSRVYRVSLSDYLKIATRSISFESFADMLKKRYSYVFHANLRLQRYATIRFRVYSFTKDSISGIDLSIFFCDDTAPQRALL